MEQRDRSFADYVREHLDCRVAAITLTAVVQNIPTQLLQTDAPTIRKLYAESKETALALYRMRTTEPVDQRRRYIEAVVGDMRERATDDSVSFKAEQIETSLMKALAVPPLPIPNIDI